MAILLIKKKTGLEVNKFSNVKFEILLKISIYNQSPPTSYLKPIKILNKKITITQICFSIE